MFFLCLFSMQYLKSVLQLSFHKKYIASMLEIIKIKVPIAFEFAACFTFENKLFPMCEALTFTASGESKRYGSSALGAAYKNQRRALRLEPTGNHNFN